jgi:hypothetical protein
LDPYIALRTGWNPHPDECQTIELSIAQSAWSIALESFEVQASGYGFSIHLESTIGIDSKFEIII